MQKYQLGLNKKSFSLFYNGGEIWCEHLDSMYEKRELVIEKFKQDLIMIAKPSTSSFIAINLDETVVDQELLDYIVNELTTLEKSIQKVAFVGLDFGMKRHIRKKHTDFQIKCIDDYEKAKEWLV